MSSRSFASRRRGAVAWVGAHGVLLLVCLLVVAPIYFLVLGSFKTVEEFFASPFGLPQQPSFDNYQRAWTEASVGTTLKNSAIVTISAVIISTVVSCLASYSIARLPLRGALFWRLLFVGGLIVPVQLIMVAIFIIMRHIHLLGTLGSLILVYSTFGIPLGILVLVSFFQALPRELGEAAKIDGATDFQTFWRVIMPLSIGPIFTVVILNGVWIWNDFFIALVLSTKPSVETLPLGILNFFGVYSTEWGLIFASVVISALPVVILYLLMTRRFIAGMTAGSVKG